MNINKKFTASALSILLAFTGFAGAVSPAMAAVGNGSYARAATNLT